MACEHDTMELLDTLRPQVELWGCSWCEYEEVRVVTNVVTEEYVVV